MSLDKKKKKPGMHGQFYSELRDFIILYLPHNSSNGDQHT